MTSVNDDDSNLSTDSLVMSSTEDESQPETVIDITENTLTSPAEKIKTFDELQINDQLKALIKKRGWINLMPIQAQAIPLALKGHDIIGLASTGTGKTVAFLIPIINNMLLKHPHSVHSLIITPLRELCIQICDEVKFFGALVNIRTTILVGGVRETDQIVELAKSPHVVIGTPGRLLYHLEKTRGFDMNRLTFLVLDEADRLLNADFEECLEKILNSVNTDRQTFLFSATMTNKLSKLQRMSMSNPVKVDVDNKAKAAANIQHKIILVSLRKKFEYLAAFLLKFSSSRTIVFCNTCKIANVLNIYLKKFGIDCIALSGSMKQVLRQSNLAKFKSMKKRVLITTEVAARGLNLPDVDIVVNFDVPMTYRDYIHRVGRTARAGKHGCAFTFITKLDVVRYKLIEQKIFGNDKDALPQVDNQLDEIVKKMEANYDFLAMRSASEKEYAEMGEKKSSKKH